jgi:hypothetical protein
VGVLPPSRPLGKALLVVGASIACSLGARDARATLGESVPSVSANEQHLGAVHRVVKLATGERHELALPSGFVVHEYVSPAGMVYAVTWHGHQPPNLQELLGSYFGHLATGHDSAQGHNRLNLVDSDFAIQAWGHGRNFSGRAWVPSLVPAGVKVDSSLD